MEVGMRTGKKLALGAILTLGMAFAFAGEDAKPAAAAAPGQAVSQEAAVAKNAISAESDDHCLKARAQCDKSGAKGSGKQGARAHKMEGAGSDCPKGADCPKGEDCAKHGQCVKQKSGEAKASSAPAGAAAPGTPAAKPADGKKTGSQPG
jgi:hypothetical protein